MGGEKYMKEPKLRFKADDGSDFPDWEEKKLGKLTEKINRRGTNSTADIRMISQGNGFILQSDKYSRENAGESLKKYTLLKKNEFAYNHGASKMKPYGVCYRLCESDEARVPYVYHTFRFISEIEDFWNYALNTSKMDRQLKKIVSSGARMDGLLNIGYDAYMSVSVMVPSLPEQQKIADFLSTIDTIIEKQQATVLAWEERKKGVMQKLFSQEVRFKADDGSDFPDWEEKRLGDVFEERTERSVGGEELLSVTISQGVIRQSDSDKRNNSSENKSNYKVVKKNDLAYNTMRMWQGAEGVSDFDGIVSPAYTVVTPLDGNNGKYFEIFFKQISMLHLFQRYSQGLTSDTWNLKFPSFAKIKCCVPCEKEQNKIVNCIVLLDTVIQKQKETLEKWQELKKGLLQQMFV